jgi:hypothetical protein
VDTSVAGERKAATNVRSVAELSERALTRAKTKTTSAAIKRVRIREQRRGPSMGGLSVSGGRRELHTIMCRAAFAVSVPSLPLAPLPRRDDDTRPRSSGSHTAGVTQLVRPSVAWRHLFLHRILPLTLFL